LRIEEVITEQGPVEPLFPGLANLFLDSVQVTVLEGGDRINVIPPVARAQLDIRLLPDTDSEAFLARVHDLLGRDLSLRVVLSSPPSAPSPVDRPFFEIAARVLGKEAPVVPTFISGFTDSRYFRERGIPAYGLLPFALEVDDLRGIHGADERIPLVELDRGVERLKEIVAAYATGEGPTP
jgi:acetylornithine deacetylase/succinyl-diaminopimelate desuccinylase-like protein